MSACKYSREWLAAFVDGEASERTTQTRDHVERCRECQALVAQWAGPVTSCARWSIAAWARSIRSSPCRTSATASRPRRAVPSGRASRPGGTTSGSSIGAPSPVRSRGRAGGAGGARRRLPARRAAPSVLELTGPAVVVEALEVGGGASAVVWGGGGETSTLIWVQPGAEDSHEGTF